MLTCYSDPDFQFTHDIQANVLGANKHLLCALLLVLAVHITVIAYWKVDQISQIHPRIMHVDLVPTIEKYMKQKENIKEINATTVVSALELPLPKLSEPKDEVQKDDIFEKLPRKSLYQDVITSIRKNTRAVPKKYLTFGTSDFPQKADNHDPYAPPSYIPVLVSAPGTVSATDSQGYGMIMKDDGFGNVSCSQQRPGAGTEGPMWYRVPASMCGHLR